MSPTNTQALSAVAPLLIVLFLAQEGNGAGRTIATLVALLPTAAAAFLGARFAWSPLFRRLGLWRTSFLLGCAVLAVGLGAAVCQVCFGDPRGLLSLSTRAAMAALVFGWYIAAIGGAQEKGSPAPSTQPTSPPSRLFRGRRRAVH